MDTLKNMLAESAGELKKLPSLTMASFLAAIYAVSYSPVAGNFIIIPGVIEIRFGFIAIAVAGALFGPVVAVPVAVIGDILGTLLFYGGAFFWGYTLNWSILGFAMGLFFYKEKISVPRIVLATMFKTFVIDLLITTKCEQMMGFGTFEALFMKRLFIKTAMFPVNMILLLLVLKSVCTAYRRLRARMI